MHKIVILLGSNRGDSKNLILKAKYLLESKLGTFLKASSLYESEAWGFKSDNAFLNQVLVFKTQLKIQEILKIALDIENELGRIRSHNGYASRTMDIDLLFYDNLTIEEVDLQIPHPRLHLRRFTLEPLGEIMPDFVHPKLHKTIRELLVSCKDDLNTTKLEY
ncbi:MAG: 2-amino-4-hydroxy-6-hydroxymethyldihydropteridine diphosphokinase [Bacteroidales bacterium]|jgi:2-amino-4-hydroxy-6-hydroxymethyldihydropteridine diphosphokinase|nr:2-amino-4-hydroxy-6-hydroxymethyldihydropteridine diphosphokinase [Bacteroidales bacterium]